MVYVGFFQFCKWVLVDKYFGNFKISNIEVKLLFVLKYELVLID